MTDESDRAPVNESEIAVSSFVRGGYVQNATMSDLEPAQPTTDFRIDETERIPGTDIVVMSVHGDTDMYVADELRVRLTTAIDDAPTALVLDLSGVTFLDSMALGVLLGGLKRMRALGGQLRVVTPAEIRRIFEMTMLDELFDIDSSQDEALAATSATG